jgi:hypothetical protein
MLTLSSEDGRGVLLMLGSCSQFPCSPLGSKIVMETTNLGITSIYRGFVGVLGRVLGPEMERGPEVY